MGERPDAVDALGLIILVVLVAFIAFMMGLSSGVSMEQEKAIKAGVGHWKLIDNTSRTEFVYGADNHANQQ